MRRTSTGAHSRVLRLFGRHAGARLAASGFTSTWMGGGGGCGIRGPGKCPGGMSADSSVFLEVSIGIIFPAKLSLYY